MITYVGIDPGFSGAIASITGRGEIRVADLPVSKNSHGDNEYNRRDLYSMLMGWSYLPGSDVRVGLEFPTTRPGEGAERSKRFGVGLGLIEGMLVALNRQYERVFPSVWKGALGVPGKDWENANEIGLELIKTLYAPVYRHEDFHGPRGGLLDGRVDATLIAHFLRARSFSGLQEMALQFGKNSVEAQALILGKSTGRQRMKLPKKE